MWDENNFRRKRSVPILRAEIMQYRRPVHHRLYEPFPCWKRGMNIILLPTSHNKTVRVNLSSYRKGEKELIPNKHSLHFLHCTGIVTPALTESEKKERGMK